MVWVQLAKDRNQWRILVNNFIYTAARYEKMSAYEEGLCCVKLANYLVSSLKGGGGVWWMDRGRM
jgi:hypothetical protein